MNNQKPEILSNVPYGPDKRNVADVYLPPGRNRTDTRLGILIHGGSWTNGDKSDLAGYIFQMRKLLPGFAFANINYRLAGSYANKFPAQEEDVKLAVRFLLSKTNEYGISGTFILMGMSAGAHLALLQGYKHTDILKPAAIVSFFAPSDLVDMYMKPINPSLPLLMQALTGYSYLQNPEVYSGSSPVTFVKNDSAPTILFHGSKDQLVPVSQAYALKDKLTLYKVKHELVVYPGEGHGWIGESLADSFRRIVSFLNEHVV